MKLLGNLDIREPPHWCLRPRRKNFVFLSDHPNSLRLFGGSLETNLEIADLNSLVLWPLKITSFFFRQIKISAIVFSMSSMNENFLLRPHVPFLYLLVVISLMAWLLPRIFYSSYRKSTNHNEEEHTFTKSQIRYGHSVLNCYPA